MPEGDVVFRAARRLHAALAGRELTLSDLRWPSLATVDLRGRSVLEVVSRGKHLLLRVAPDDAGPPLTLHSHLRMEGSWHVHATGQPWRTARAASGVRAVLATAEWTAVGHRLGMLDLLPTAAEHRLVGHLGPDVLGPGWGPQAVQEVLGHLRAQPARAVGEALLDQRVLAGVGTYFMAEALFVRATSPWTPVGEVDARGGLEPLVGVLRRMLLAGTEDVAHGSLGYVHARSGLPCRRCGTVVRVAPIGRPPQERTAFSCPTCQPGPRPTDDGAPQAPLGSGRRPGRGVPPPAETRRSPGLRRR